MRVLIASLFALLWTTPALAEWHRASSTNFVIYSNDRPQRLREFATKLERFDTAVRALRNMEKMPASKGNRLTIFVLKDDDAVRRLRGEKGTFLQGFYKPDAAGSVAFVPQRVDGGADDSAQAILLHEIAHHLMLQNLSTPYPEWLIEGFAEFMSMARFDKDGTVGLGLPAAHRSYGLLYSKPLPIEALLSGRYENITVEQRESIYGRGWLLSHYLVFEQKRRGQIEAYLTGIAQGVDPLQAAQRAFGDLRKLDRDMEDYMRRSKLQYWRVKPGQADTGPIEVTALTPGAAAVMAPLMELRNGATVDKAKGIAGRVRAVAQQYPGDLLVETTLADAELAAENFAAAEAAADRALKVDPQSTDAMILKGRAILDRARNSDDPKPADFVTARSWFTRANKIDPEDPEPLVEFFKSYVFGGVRPHANAIEALHYASNLAPQDPGLRMNSALQYLRDGKLKDARLTLAPIAYDPHGRQNAAAARRIMARIDAGDARGAEQAARSGSESE